MRCLTATLILTLAWPHPAFALKAQAPPESSGLEELSTALGADAGLEEPTGDTGSVLGGPKGEGQTRREFLKTLSALVQLGTRLGVLADALSPPATSPSVPAWEPYRELLRDVASATTINPVADAEWFTESLTQWLASVSDGASEWELDERTLQQLMTTRQLLQRGDEDARAFQEKVATADGRAALIQEVRQLWNPEVPTDWMRAMDAKGAPVSPALRAFFTSAEPRNAGRSRELAAMLEALTDEQVADGLAWATAERLRVVQGRIEPWTASFKRLLGPDWADVLRRYESEHSQFVQAPQRAAPRSGDAPQGTPDRKSTEARPDQRTAPVAQKSPVGPEDSGILGLLLARMPQPDTGESVETWLRQIHAPQGPGLVSPVEEAARRLRTLLRNYHFAQQAALWDAFVTALPSVQENPYQVAWLTGTLEHAAALRDLQGPPSEAPIQQALTLLRAAGMEEGNVEGPSSGAQPERRMERRTFLRMSSWLSWGLRRLLGIGPTPSDEGKVAATVSADTIRTLKRVTQRLDELRHASQALSQRAVKLDAQVRPAGRAGHSLSETPADVSLADANAQFVKELRRPIAGEMPTGQPNDLPWAIQHFQVRPMPEATRRAVPGSRAGFVLIGDGLRFAKPLALAAAQGTPLAVVGVVPDQTAKHAVLADLQSAPVARAMLDAGLVVLDHTTDAIEARKQAFERLQAAGATIKYVIETAHDDAVAQLLDLLALVDYTLLEHPTQPGTLDPDVRAAALTLLQAA